MVAMIDVFMVVGLGLGWVGLGWIGLGWIGLGWIGEKE
jgi:hypothetical protein